MPEDNPHSYASFDELYHAYKSIVYNTCLSYVQSREDAEDVTQNVFVEVHNSLHSFRGESMLKTWIYRIAINKSLDHLKHKNRKKRFGSIFGLFDTGHIEESASAADFDHPGIKLENKEKASLLFKALQQLPESQKTAFILSRIEGMSNIEIADVLKKNVGAVESLLSRSQENLRKILTSKK